MQKRTSSTNKLLSLLFPGFLLLIAILFFSSCNDADDKTEHNASLTNQADTGTMNLKLNCVILTKAQVQTWVDSGWTKPGSTQIKDLVFQPFTADVKSINTNMQLIVYPGQSSTDVKLYGKQLMSVDTSCPGKTISGPLIFANVSVKLDSLKILNPDGTLNDFDFIRLVPTQDYPLYINYKIEIVRKGEVQTLQGRGGLPCPPYCCPPNCE